MKFSGVLHAFIKHHHNIGTNLALVGNYAVLNRLATSRVGSKASISET